MDKCSIEILTTAISKIENKNANYRKNKKWILLNDKLQKCYLILAREEYNENLMRYNSTGDKKYADKMKIAYDYLCKNAQGGEHKQL